MARTIPLDALTVEDLVNLGPRAINDQLPKELLVTVARIYVQERLRQRQRAASLSAERRAYRAASGGEDDALGAAVLAASLAAAAQVTFDWTPLIDVPFLVPSTGNTTTWGLAAVDEHRDRAEYLEHHSAGLLRTAVQHRSAINDLDANGAERLLQLVGR